MNSSILPYQPAALSSAFPAAAFLSSEALRAAGPSCSQHDPSWLHAPGASNTVVVRRWDRSCLLLRSNSDKEWSYISVLTLDVLVGIQTSQLTPISREWNTCRYNQSPCLFTKHCSQNVSCGQIAAKHSKISSHPSYSNISKIKGKLKNIEKNQAASAVRNSIIQYVPILRAEEG